MTQATNQPRAVIYTRVSRDDTGEGASNKRQEEACRKLTEYRGWNVVDVQEDVSISAYSGKKRPGWERTLSMVERGEVEYVVAWHLDRMTRSMVDLEQLILVSERHNVGIATVVGDIDLTNDMGRMIARILAAVARAEVERKSARQRLANAQRRAEGKRWRSAWRAFGYAHDEAGAFVIVPEEANAIRDAARDVLDGKSLAAVAREWREAGLTTPRSQKGKDGWTHQGVRSILLNARNAGLQTYEGHVVGRGDWEPILTEEQHAELVAHLSDPSRRTNGSRTGRRPQTLLSAIATCATCGETVHGGSVGRVRQGASYRVPAYRCPNEHLAAYRSEIDERVRSEFAAAVALMTPGSLVPLSGSPDRSNLHVEAQQLRDRLDGAARSFAGGSIDEKQMALISESILGRLAEVETALADSGGERDILALRAESVADFLKQDLDGQRAILSRLTTITLHPKGRGNHRGKLAVERQIEMTVRQTTPAGVRNVTLLRGRN